MHAVFISSLESGVTSVHRTEFTFGRTSRCAPIRRTERMLSRTSRQDTGAVHVRSMWQVEWKRAPEQSTVRELPDHILADRI